VNLYSLLETMQWSWW